VKHRRLRVAVVTGLLVALAGGTWIYFAPIGIGGGTAYVVTHGVSMEPRFHTGDLAIVRAASTYKVGQIVAYHSSLLHEVVLHRIVAIHHGRYVFKGDNNNFLDPVHPTQSELIGRLWIHVPRVGAVLEAIRTPLGLATVAGVIGLLMFGFVRDDRNGNRSRFRGTTTPADTRAVKPIDSETSLANGLRDGLIAAGLAVVVFAALSVFAFDRPYRVAGTRAVPYAQRAVFTYSAHVQPDAVYPSGRLATGDPIFLNFVNALTVGLNYRLLAPGAAHVSGTSTVALRLTGPTGWSRTFPLVRKRVFTNGHFESKAVLNLTSVKNLFSQVETLTGVSGSPSTVTIVATVHLFGRVSGNHVRKTFSPVMSFQMSTTQLQPDGASGNLVSGRSVFTDVQHATVRVASSRPNPIHLFGHFVSVKLLRFLAVVGLLMSSLAGIALGIMLQRRGRLAEPEQIEAQYRNVIVPIADDAAFLDQEPVDLASMEALVRLAEHYGRLILHSRRNGADSYLLDDGAVLYRYRVGKAAGKSVNVPRAAAPGAAAVTASHPALRAEAGAAAPPTVSPAGSAATASRAVAPPGPAVKTSAPVSPTGASASPRALSVSEAAAAFAAAALAAASPDAAAVEPPAPVSSNGASSESPAPVSSNGASPQPPTPVPSDGVSTEPPWLVFADGIPAQPERAPIAAPVAAAVGVQTATAVVTPVQATMDANQAIAGPSSISEPRANGLQTTPQPTPVPPPTVVPPELGQGWVSAARLPQPPVPRHVAVVAEAPVPRQVPVVPQTPVVPQASAWVPPTPPGFPPSVPPTPSRVASLGPVPPHAQVANASPLANGQIPALSVDAPSSVDGVVREPRAADVGALAARVLIDSARRWRRRLS
jgi:signal peptidase I